MLKRMIVLSILFCVLILVGCSKNSTSPENDKKDSTDVVPEELPKDTIGLIDNFPLQEPPSRTIYIDPENTNSQTMGTIDNPHSSMAKVRFVPNLTIAFKRGTTYRTDQQITIETDNIAFMSYGESTERPVIESTVESYAMVGHYLGVKNIIIRDLEIHSVGGAASITFNPADGNNANISIINCKLHGGTWGLRSMGTTGLLVENTEVYDTGDDGMFIAWDEDIEIRNCYVHNVNTNWKPPHTPESEAGGDAIQLADCDNWHVHHNLLDRSSSGNKFCFISNNANQKNGILEHNKLIGPLVDGTSIYIHDGANLIFRYNIIMDCPGNPIYSHAANLKFYGNVVTRMGSPIYISGSGHIFRNTFHDVYRVADGNNLTLESNIFSFVSAEQKDYNTPGRFAETNNLYSDASRVESNSFDGNPDFVSVENDDFRLGENSDAIDRGTNTPMTKDMYGTEIPQGDAPDVGAFEKL